MTRNDFTEHPTEYEIFLNKRTDRIYLSKSLETTQLKPSELEGVVEIKRQFRILSKVFDGEEHHFIKEGKELVLRITPSARQEIIAKFYEDTRGIFVLQIQKFTSDSGNPHQISFSFIGDEIGKLYNFIRNIALLPIKGKESGKFDDKYLDEIILTNEQITKVFLQHPELVSTISEFLKNDINQKDLIALGHRKEQLKKFDNLLHDEKFFQNEKAELKARNDESVWQKFFEANTWILGYGLNYIFNSPLEGKKLEQITSGNDVFNAGKRVDVFMKTRGIINSLCFGEIKTHKTPLLKKVTDAYRRECWAANDELAGGISQIQKTVQKSIKNIQTKTPVKTETGDLTGEELYLYQPKSFLLIGSLEQFKGEHGINEDKFSSFELFRRGIHNPEILTFDELFERAQHIIKNPLCEEQNNNEEN
ncbi:MAG: DUF4263 domain-containing protein [Ignavibacteria bacterium CG_4_9_14_3_um_filter_36_18]|nr:DUF4263 domain-containing protein [Ignavibacteria bacterium]PJB01787.1 MAG: DUF4263 domain-containing protein [Ignavibacteria bacterium CG_4_9_14_3_um_filter_36_18]